MCFILIKLQRLSIKKYNKCKIKVQESNFQNYQNFQYQNIFIIKMLEVNVRPSLNKMKKPHYTYIEDYLFNQLDLLGEGFSSKVYKGINSNSKKQVAIKVINTDILSEPIHVTLLQSELKVLEKLKGRDNILEMHSIILQGKDTYIVTEVCQTDLARILNPLLPIETVEKYLQQLIRGFKEIFSQQIIHRDLKPANLLIDSNGMIKIADFGFAIKFSEARKQTKFNIGSPLYMAPEALKRNQYSPKSDVWSIGIILYEMLTGDTPWKAQNEDQLYQKLQKIKIEDILANDNFPQHLNNFLIKTLQFDRKSRISPQELFLLNIRTQQNVKQNIQQIIVINEIKSQNMLIVPKHTKGTKTEKFYKPSINKLTDMHKTHKKGCAEMNQDSASGNIKLVRRNTETKEFHQMTLINIPYDGKQTISNSSAKTIGSNTVTAVSDIEVPQTPKMTKQQLKQITNNLVYYIHFCRLLYKDLVRIDECIENKLNKRVVESLESIRDSIFRLYCNVIVKYTHKVKNVASNNFIDLPQHKLDQYIASSQYKKVRKVCSDYIQKYSKSNQLKYFWVQRQDPNLSATIDQTTGIIGFLWAELCQKNHSEIILLQFLLFSKEALQALEKGSFDTLSNKQRIQDYVDTIPNPPSFGRFKRAIAQAKKISAQAKLEKERKEKASQTQE